MKTKNIIITLLCCTLVTFSIKAFATIKQDRKVGTYTSVSVSSGIDLYLTQGNSHSVSIETDEDIIDKIETFVENGTLTIRVKRGERINWRKGKLTLIAHVSMPVVEKVLASGGSDVYMQTPIESKGNIEFTFSGGADLKAATVNAKEVELRFSGGSDSKELNVTADKFTALVSGGSDIKRAIVNAPTVDIKTSGGSDAEIKVNAETVNALTSGGSDVILSGKTNSIIAKASGASDIKAAELSYEKSDISKSGGSDIYLKK